MKTITCSFALVACVALLATPARANADTPPPPLRLVGAVLSTGQALVWDTSVEAYALLRLGQRYNGYVVQRLLADRIVLSHERQVVELRLGRALLVTAKTRGVERRGAPAMIITGERQIASKPAPVVAPAAPAPPAVAPPAVAPPAVAPPAVAPPAPAASPIPRRALPQLPPDPPAAPTPPAPVKLQEVRSEVSAFIQGQRAYRGSFARSGGVLLDGLAAGSLLQRLGLRDGDLVLSVGGVKLSTRDAAMNAYLAMTSGRVVDVVLIRNGRRQTLSLNLT